MKESLLSIFQSEREREREREGFVFQYRAVYIFNRDFKQATTTTATAGNNAVIKMLREVVIRRISLKIYLLWLYWRLVFIVAEIQLPSASLPERKA